MKGIGGGGGEGGWLECTVLCMLPMLHTTTYCYPTQYNTTAGMQQQMLARNKILTACYFQGISHMKGIGSVCVGGGRG